MKKFKASIITLFPEVFPGTLGCGVIGRALKNGLWDLEVIDLKDYSVKGRVDDTPYGGGSGMVIAPDIMGRCIDKVLKNNPNSTLLFPSPSGKLINQEYLKSFSYENIIIPCYRYEGGDERIKKYYKGKGIEVLELSIGDYVLAGGEVAAQVILEAIIRNKENVLNNPHSLVEESFSNGLLEYPYYTRPYRWRNLRAPKVLLSGNHKSIAKWKINQSLKKTKQNRPDLYKEYKSKLKNLKKE